MIIHVHKELTMVPSMHPREILLVPHAILVAIVQLLVSNLQLDLVTLVSIALRDLLSRSQQDNLIL